MAPAATLLALAAGLARGALLWRGPRPLTLLAAPGGRTLCLLEPETGSVWSFAGSLAGRPLVRLPSLQDH